MLRISLTQGQEAIIDDEDYELVSQYKWYAKKSKNTYYALTNSSRKTGKKKIYLHKVIIGTTQGIIDHKNGNGLDNRKENLRIASHTKNIINQYHPKGTSQYKGVYFNKDKNRWVAQIRNNYKRINLGSYITEEEAAKSYDKAAFVYHGEFAKLNFLSSEGGCCEDCANPPEIPRFSS